MPQPEVKEEITAGPLQNVSIAYRNKDYIGDRIFPILDGADPKAKVYKYRKGAWFRDEAGIRAPGARARRGGWVITPVSISTNEYAFAKEVTDEDRRFARLKSTPPLQPDTDAVEFCSDKIALNKERRVAALIKDSTWMDGNATGADAEGGWAAGGSNTFLADITTGRKTIQLNTGFDPNVLMIDYQTFLSLKEESTILDKIKHTQRAVFGADLLAALLELEEVLVGRAIYSTAEETAAGDDFTGTRIWEVTADKGMGFLFYRAPKLGLKVATAGMQVRIAYESGQLRRLSSWREAAEHQDVYESAEETDIVATCSDLGYKWKDTYAT